MYDQIEFERKRTVTDWVFGGLCILFFLSQLTFKSIRGADVGNWFKTYRKQTISIVFNNLSRIQSFFEPKWIPRRQINTLKKITLPSWGCSAAKQIAWDLFVLLFSTLVSQMLTNTVVYFCFLMIAFRRFGGCWCLVIFTLPHLQSCFCQRTPVSTLWVDPFALFFFNIHLDVSDGLSGLLLYFFWGPMSALLFPDQHDFVYWLEGPAQTGMLHQNDPPFWWVLFCKCLLTQSSSSLVPCGCNSLLCHVKTLWPTKKWLLLVFSCGCFWYVPLFWGGILILFRTFPLLWYSLDSVSLVMHQYQLSSKIDFAFIWLIHWYKQLFLVKNTAQLHLIYHKVSYLYLPLCYSLVLTVKINHPKLPKAIEDDLLGLGADFRYWYKSWTDVSGWSFSPFWSLLVGWLVSLGKSFALFGSQLAMLVWRRRSFSWYDIYYFLNMDFDGLLDCKDVDTQKCITHSIKHCFTNFFNNATIGFCLMKDWRFSA